MLARRSGGERRYLLVGGGLLAGYVVAAVVLTSTRDFDDRGPLSLNNSPVENLPIARECFADARPDEVKVVGGSRIDGVVYFACFKLYDDGTVEEARVVDERGFRVSDAGVIKKGGAWPWVGTVTRTSDLIFAGFPLAALVGLGWLYHRRNRPPPPTQWWERGAVAFVLACIPVVGWLTLAALPVPRARKARAALQAVFALAGLLVFSFLVVAATTGDTWGVVAVGMIAAALAWALVGGRFLVAAPVAVVRQAEPPAAPASLSPPALDAEAVAVSGPPPQRPRVKARGDQADPFSLTAPGDLPSFADVGGMDVLKRELKDSFGLMLAFAGEARAYRLRWNGLLLHGPPGVGKTFIARSTAGEFGLSFVHVSTADIVSSYAGEAARNVRRAFSFAAAHVPCILFFDEFDSIAQRRDDWPNQEARRTVNELLRAVEEWRKVPELIVMAATNDLDSLDPAVIRPGRFDRHIRVDLPDATARAAIFTAQLKGRPVEEGLDVEELAQLAEGLTPAGIARAVESASLRAFR
ncbi:MAG: AAA family ATPase, partial [Actinomycetota bacterium]|nr:AAA family ATPase [Actinomycetota bacterium]